MSLYLFPKDGSKSLRYEFVGREGGTVVVPAGRYDALCLNSDTEKIFLRCVDRLETFEIATRETALWESLGVRPSAIPRAEGAEEEPVVASPDRVWYACGRDLDLNLETGAHAIVLLPGDALCTIDCTIVDAENLKYVSALSASLSRRLVARSGRADRGARHLPLCGDVGRRGYRDGQSALFRALPAYGRDAQTDSLCRAGRRVEVVLYLRRLGTDAR